MTIMLLGGTIIGYWRAGIVSCPCRPHPAHARFNSCHVLQDLPSNTSDHCPLVAEVRSNVICCPQKQKKNKHPLYNWRKLSQKEISESYSKTLCNKLRELNPPSSTTNPSAIEEYLHSICSAMQKSCEESIPLRCSNISKSQAGTPQLMLPIDAPKLLGNDGSYLTTQTTPLAQLGKHT